ncbi:MAG: hypothetical protein EAZ47_01185 [Bacteroidetes bacterium]|nr:MAG: hypothetical protein EAY72_01195 [Bacteroidota bacterium]TAF98018.1 MAG: hypothetical protein EAZ47_01185 [Bacteroidota bacterium]
MKRILLLSLVAVGALATSCRKIIVDDNNNTVIVQPPSGGGSGGQTITLRGRIDTSLTLTANNNYIIDGLTYMVNNATLTIQPGVTIKGNFTGANVAALIITRGAKIVANGTATAPIVFTSASPNPRSGDWGGIVICGRAPVNSSSTAGAGTFLVEGGVNNSFGDGIAGGTDATDSSGVLRYVRIDYAGYAFNPDQEINSLTLAAVGSRTRVEYVQVSYAKDDAFEWFGGTVNCRYLVSYKTQDDDFDSDNGYRGTVQFGLIVRDSSIADVSRSEAFESDNDANGTVATPKTLAVFSNVTAIGPRATTSNIGNSLYLCGAQIRRNSAISIFNSVFMGWPAGLLIDDSRGQATWNNVTDSSIRFRGNLIAGCAIPINYAAATPPTGTSAAIVSNHFMQPFFNNQILANNEQVGYTRPFDYNNPDFSPFASANVNIPGFPGGPNPITNGFSFADPKLANNSFITPVTFRGAVGPAGEFNNWYKGWTRFGN